MKKKGILLLIVGMLLAGCSKNSVSNLKESNANIADDASIEKTSEKDTLEGADETTSESTTESEQAQGEEDVYILNFEANTIDGEALTSQVFSQSKLTMINVWATYCNPCLSEMPDLGEIAASYDSAEFQMLGIISDVAEGASEGDITNAKDLIAQTKATYPHLLLNESLYTNLVGAVDSVPTTFFVNQRGEVIGYSIGAKPKADWEEVINGLLEEMKKE